MPDTGTVASTMRAARVDEVRGTVRVADMAVPKIGPDDALVRIVASSESAAATGISGTATGTGSASSCPSPPCSATRSAAW